MALHLEPLLYAPTALKNQKYEALYKDFLHFNVIQTMVFPSLYKSNDNVLVAAPAGSGKTICAEFAILKNHLNAQSLADNHMLVLYITPIESLADKRYCDWGPRFGVGLQVPVNILTGIPSVDSEILAKGGIIIATAYNWGHFSRLDKTPRVTLLIVDELHLIGGQGGAVLEAIVCRMKNHAIESGNKIRIVALSTSLANQIDLDLGVWIGAGSHTIFNFSHDLLQVPLERHIRGVDISDFEARMQAMVKLTCTAVGQHGKNRKPALVYVPSRKYVQLTAVDLMTYAYGAEKSSFRLCPDGVIEPFIENLSDITLKDTLRSGVGYLHEDLSILDQEVVCHLFETGLIQVCVITSSMCWGVRLLAHLVVVMGTEYYDGQENVHTDYPVTDLLQMMGRAWRLPIQTAFRKPSVLDNSKCVILCHASREKYYKEFPYDALPVESCLDRDLLDQINAELSRGVIKTQTDCINYFRTTFLYTRLKRTVLYKRLKDYSWCYELEEFSENDHLYLVNQVMVDDTKAPWYHRRLQGVTEKDLLRHLNQLMQNTFDDLLAYRMCQEKDSHIEISVLGKIASRFYVSCSTIARFRLCHTSQMLKDYVEKRQIKTIEEFVEILSDASEYSHLPIRRGEVEVVQRLVNHQRLSFDNPRYTDPHVKANALLHAHFSRHPLCGDLASDQREVLLIADRLLLAMPLVFGSMGLLNHTISAVRMFQMVTQGMWDSDSMLLQLPHFTKELAKRCEDNPGKRVTTIDHLGALYDDERRELLQMPDAELLDISGFMNQFPKIELKHEVLNSENIRVMDRNRITMEVTLQRQGTTEVGLVNAMRYPKAKEEIWWLLVGDPNLDRLLEMKRVFPQERTVEKLQFTAPAKPGEKKYRLYLICDSYLGCDQEYDFALDIPDEDSWALFQSAEHSA